VVKANAYGHGIERVGNPCMLAAFACRARGCQLAAPERGINGCRASAALGIYSIRGRG